MKLAVLHVSIFVVFPSCKAVEFLMKFARQFDSTSVKPERLHMSPSVCPHIGRLPTYSPIRVEKVPASLWTCDWLRFGADG